MTPNLFRASLLALLLSATPALPALADDGRGVTAEETAKILQDLGYRAKLGKDGVGDPMITSAMAGLTIYVYFYDCSEGRCGSLQLSVGLDLDDGTTHAVVNAFNTRYRYGRVYLDNENDPYLQFDFEVLHSNHVEHISSQVEIFERLLGDFARDTGFLGGHDAESPAAATDAAVAPKPTEGKIDA